MQTNFNVSNTDVITMLIVKQKEFLQKKHDEIRDEWLTKLGNLEEQIVVEYNKKIAEFKNK